MIMLRIQKIEIFISVREILNPITHLNSFLLLLFIPPIHLCPNFCIAQLPQYDGLALVVRSPGRQ